MILLIEVPNVGSRGGWELYIVTGGVVVGIFRPSSAFHVIGNLPQQDHV
jgi:hypothetical protein